MLNYNQKQKELLYKVPENVSDDLMHVIQILDYRNQKDIAKMLNESRKDLLFYNNSINLIDDYDIADNEYGINGYETFVNKNKNRKDMDVRIATELLNDRLDLNEDGFVNNHMSYNLVSTKKNNFKEKIDYSLKDKIKYYQERSSGKYKGKRLSDGQVNYARKFLEINGIKL